MTQSSFHRFELQSALHDDYRRVFTVQGQDLLLLQHAGQLHLLENTCPHAAYPLHEGLLAGDTLRCPMHGYLFDLHSGACTSYTEGPCRGLYRYELSAEDGWLGVRLPLVPLQTGPFQTGKGI
jgi:nitrite reductase/ring-hydroxylating ferredoxin subunit